MTSLAGDLKFGYASLNLRTTTFEEARLTAEWLYDTIPKTKSTDKKGKDGIKIEVNSFFEDAVFALLQISDRRLRSMESGESIEDESFWSELQLASQALWSLRVLKQEHNWWHSFPNHLLALSLGDPNLKPRASSELNVVLTTPERCQRYQDILKANNTIWELMVGLRFAKYTLSISPDDPLSNQTGSGVKVPDVRFTVKHGRLGAPPIRIAAECKRLEGDLNNLGGLVSKAREQVLAEEPDLGVADIPMIIVNLSSIVEPLGTGSQHELLGRLESNLGDAYQNAQVSTQISEALGGASPLPTVLLVSQGVGMCQRLNSETKKIETLPTTANSVHLFGEITPERKQRVEMFVSALKA